MARPRSEVAMQGPDGDSNLCLMSQMFKRLLTCNPGWARMMYCQWRTAVNRGWFQVMDVWASVFECEVNSGWQRLDMWLVSQESFSETTLSSIWVAPKPTIQHHQ